MSRRASTRTDLHDLDQPAAVAERVAAWRYAGPLTPWEEIVGHQRQVRRCRELVERLRRPEEDLVRLGLARGRGLLITGPPGTGKTLLARALATDLGRTVIAPPTAELTPGLIRELYAHLAEAEPTVVVLDEAEGLIGTPWPGASADADRLRALLAALDGVSRPADGPYTVAITAASGLYDPAATRPGRLSPRLDLDLPAEADRAELFRRAIAPRPLAGPVDVGVLAERTSGWSGAEVIGAVEEAVSRSLLDGTDAVRMDLLLDVISERFLIVDCRPERPDAVRTTALHEASHAIFAELTWPGSVAFVELGHHGGGTRLVDEVNDALPSVKKLRQLAALALAGAAGERVCLGVEGMTVGAADDHERATRYLMDALNVLRSYSTDAVERDDRRLGPISMRTLVWREVTVEAEAAFGEALAVLAPHRAAIEHLADVLLAADDRTLSGPPLAAAIGAALDVSRRQAARGSITGSAPIPARGRSGHDAERDPGARGRADGSARFQPRRPADQATSTPGALGRGPATTLRRAGRHG